jgi:hypothetical protein
MRSADRRSCAGPLGSILWACLFLSMAAALSGQTFEQRVDDVVARARYKIGPFRIQPVLEFSQLGWVSNIYGGAQAEQLISDFLITPSPKLNVYFILKRRLILSFTENPEYHFYFKSHRFNHFTNNYWAELSFPFFGSLIISAGYFFQDQRSLAVAEVDRLVESVNQGVRTEVSYQTGRRISFTLTGLFSRLEYADFLSPEGSPDQLGPSLNRVEYNGLLEARYQAFTSSVFFIQTGYGQDLFQEETAGWKDSESIRFLFGFRLPSQGRLSGSLAAGFRKLLNLDRSAKDYSGFIANTQLSYRLGGATSLSLSYYRDLVFSYLPNVLYYISDSINTALTVNISRFLAVQAGGSYSLLRYSGRREPEEGGGGLSPGLTGRYFNFSAGFSIPVLRGLRAGLSYHYWTRPTGVPDKRDGHLVTIDLIRQ